MYRDDALAKSYDTITNLCHVYEPYCRCRQTMSTRCDNLVLIKNSNPPFTMSLSLSLNYLLDQENMVVVFSINKGQGEIFGVPL